MVRLPYSRIAKRLYKAQSAMEYLMTYGWAILIVAVVLGALFELGVFSSASLLGTSCVAASGFLCSKPVLSGSSLTLTLGQYTGTNWNTATFCIVPSGFAPPNSMGCPSSYPQNSVGAFLNGQSGTYVFSSTPSYSFPPFGNAFSGTVWAVYTVQSYSGNLTNQIGTIIAKNVGIAASTLTSTSTSTSTSSTSTSVTSVTSTSTTLTTTSSTSTTTSITTSSTSTTTILYYYVPITLSNSQSSGTPSPFQQMITVNSLAYEQYEAGGLTNVAFYNASGTQLDSWLESGNSNTSTNTVYWVKLPNGIPASSSITIYMRFYQPLSNMQFNSNNDGEAPQLSSTYAEYDDGASVFPYYQRWGGLSALPSGWTSYGVAPTFTPTYTEFIPTNTQDSGAYSGAISSASTFPTIIEYYGNMYDETKISEYMGISSSSGSILYYLITGWWQSSTYLDYGWAGGTPVAGTYTEVNNNKVYTLAQISTTSAQWYANYVSAGTASPSAQTGMYGLFFMATYYNDNASGPVYVYWLRTRAYPPNGVMPSISFGSVS